MSYEDALYPNDNKAPRERVDDLYLKFFEDVLEVNEEINVASVKESIGNLNNAIDYYLSENNPSRKYGSYNRGRARGCHPEI